MSRPTEPAPFSPPRFGTDGIRGPAGTPPLDPETLRRIGAAFGLWLQRQGGERKRVIVGNDGRDSAGWILDALAQGLAATEVTTVDLGLCTTPALAFTAHDGGFSAGVMVSASHNPPQDNGIKLFASDGAKICDAAEHEIETLTESAAFETSSAPRVREASERLRQYQEHLANTFPDLDLHGATIVVDAANGGGAELAPAVLRGMGADVVCVACEPDGTNINQDCGALHPETLVETVRQSGAILGICLDGDGDRGIFVDEQGGIHNGDDVLVTLAPWLQARGELPADTVVATVMSNLGMHKTLSKAGIRVAVTPVGDRHITRAMRDHGYALGAEQSGHVIFSGPGNLTGDGLFTALKLLSMPGASTQGAAALFSSFTPYPQLLINVTVDHKPDLAEVEEVQAAVQAIEAALGDEGRVLLRYSGTENLCRVMLEGPTAEIVREHAESLAAIVRRALVDA